MPGFIVGGPNSYSFVSLGLKSVLYPLDNIQLCPMQIAS
jgi:hypothetical protein